MFQDTFWALVPPIIAIGLALITKEVYLSLFIGILCGGLFLNEFNVINTLAGEETGIFSMMIANMDLMIVIFLVMLGMLVIIAIVLYGTHCFGTLLESTERMSKLPQVKIAPIS